MSPLSKVLGKIFIAINAGTEDGITFSFTRPFVFCKLMKIARLASSSWCPIAVR